MADVYLPKFLRQAAVYWPPLEPSEFGEPTVASPISIKCRWDDVVKEFMTKSGDTKQSQAEAMVDRDLVVGGYLWLGAFTEHMARPADAKRIERFDKTPSVKAKKFVRVAYL